jgi:hypothetical protein
MRALQRKLDLSDPTTTPPAADAEAIAMVVIRYWGDQSVNVLEQALRIAQEEATK